MALPDQPRERIQIERELQYQFGMAQFGMPGVEWMERMMPVVAERVAALTARAFPLPE